MIFLTVLCLITLNPLGPYNAAETLSTVDLTNSTNLFEAVVRHCRIFCASNLSNCSTPIDNSSDFVDAIGRLSLEGVGNICSFEKDFVLRPRYDNALSWFISIWLLGLFFRKLFDLLARDIPSKIYHRPTPVYRSLFDVIDFVSLAVFIAAFIYRTLSYERVRLLFSTISVDILDQTNLDVLSYPVVSWRRFKYS